MSTPSQSPVQLPALTVADPVTANIQAICLAISAACNATVSVCNVLLSPEGQRTLADWRDNNKAIRDMLTKGVDWMETQIQVLSTALGNLQHGFDQQPKPATPPSH